MPASLRRLRVAYNKRCNNPRDMKQQQTLQTTPQHLKIPPHTLLFLCQSLRRATPKPIPAMLPNLLNPHSLLGVENVFPLPTPLPKGIFKEYPCVSPFGGIQRLFLFWVSPPGRFAALEGLQATWLLLRWSRW